MAEKKILIIDDNFDNFYLLKALFSVYSNCWVEWSKDGQEGLDKYYEMQPDLILLDLFMPRINGFQVLEKIRENDSTIPIIIISAFTSSENKLEAIQKGSNDFISKPIDTNQLEITMMKYVNLEKKDKTT